MKIAGLVLIKHPLFAETFHIGIRTKERDFADER
jgi:hypothetical protein